MISPDSILYIYEIRGELTKNLMEPPPSYVGLWNEDEFSYLFFTSPEDDYIKTICSNDLVFIARHEMSYRDWQVGLPPHGFELGGLCFVPPDHPNPPAEALLLDPSVVFGDGSHPTTVSCLKYLQNIIKDYNIKSMLDLGTGSGILALAAAKLGVERVLAIDKNFLSVETAATNVKINLLEDVIVIKQGEARFFIEEPFDLVVANLPFQVLRELAVLSSAGLHKIWIISGINAAQAEVLAELFAEQGYNVLDKYIDSPWVTFVIIKGNIILKT